MIRLRYIFAAITIILMVGANNSVMAKQAPWWEPLICPQIDPQSSGGSPKTARKVTLASLFFELDEIANTYADLGFREELPPPLPKETLTPNCQWVEFEGYFRPVRYHNFRGQMLADITDHYLAGGYIGLRAVHFWVQNWADQSVISHALYNRRIRIKARVYDQCLAEMQYDRQRKEPGLRFGGACHYGENTGMILTDVEIVSVISPAQIIARKPDLSDVLKRPITIEKLTYPPVYSGEYEPLRPIDDLPADASKTFRQWLRQVKSGPEAMIRKEKERHRSFSDSRVKKVRERFDHPDGRYGYLNAQPGFASLDPDQVPIKFLATKPFGEWSDTPLKWSGFGCVALTPEVHWPVAAIDAKHAVSTFACTEISLWRNQPNDEWRSSY